jgi:type I site-specific restriction-modification system R (restriction) subunit
MVTRLDLFKKEMEPAKELYTREILNFTKKYDSLGKMTIMEEPDIDTQEYIYSFEKLNGTSQKELDEIFLEISDHMEEFSKIHGIERFCRLACIWL